MADSSTSLNAANAAWLSPASFWQPRHITTSAWLGHAPFASWIVDAIRPRSVVELGTHFGFSYFVFCEAIRRLGLSSTAFALDSWQGDDQAGFYGDDVYNSVSEINDIDYAEFSTLVRGYFDDSLSRIPNDSVDLLHIDGRHGLADITHDFNAWLPKLSCRGVVLFHDTAEHQSGFGVWEFWDDVRKRYPSFEFEHSHGLGVLAVGTNIPPALDAFLGATVESPGEVRATYETLANQVHDLVSMHERAGSFPGLTALVEVKDQELCQARKKLMSCETQVEILSVQALEAAEVVALRHQLYALQHSSSWTMTKPLRTVATTVNAWRSRIR
ncbi:hypothetical protein RCH23_002730 [Cryobacterium sp. CAN_C3]|uniref:class I SAM-dependent methyltransferase n=1 Tax=unclassified Cryobacterium TaxID=2649013 RepID=UPI0018CAB55C|nr:class I SAM-dependent methyltransferase [Cryobacterium sp. CAN_C3]MEC5155335.1 hypothetical protein [Cryobacterium sp. CAN_C3]